MLKLPRPTDNRHNVNCTRPVSTHEAGWLCVGVCVCVCDMLVVLTSAVTTGNINKCIPHTNIHNYQHV